MVISGACFGVNVLMNENVIKRLFCLFVFLLLAHCGLLSAGKLEICPEHSYYFLKDGRHVVLVGVSDRQLFHIWSNDKKFTWQKYLEDISGAGLNYVRQDVCSWGGLMTAKKYPGQLTNAAWLFYRSGPVLAVDGKGKFDLTRFDQSYFDDRVKPFLREASSRGIIVELTLFEEFRKSSEFDQGLYADRNNINRLGLGPRTITSNSALENTGLMAIQHLFIDKVLAETAGFDNVIYEVSNECGGDLWAAHIIDYIHNHPKHPSKLVSAGEQTSSFDPIKGANDIVVKHRGRGGNYASDEDVYRHRQSLLSFRCNKPVSHNEYFLYANRSTDDVNFPRKMMWADFTGGGHSNFFDFAFWRGTGSLVGEGFDSRRPPDEILVGGKHLLEFVKRNDVRFWLMKPCDELARVENADDGYVFTFANPGSEYICYILGDVKMTVLLDLPIGCFNIKWYDPKSGNHVKSNELIHTGGTMKLRSPSFDQDIVLYVRVE